MTMFNYFSQEFINKDIKSANMNGYKKRYGIGMMMINM